VIDGGAADKPKRARKARVQKPWECRMCEADIGIRTRSLVKVRTDAMEDGQLRISGGRDVWVCAFCMSRGKFTAVTS
jgi:hypothetical protein